MNIKKWNIALDLVLIVLLLTAIILLSFTVTACKKAESKCENNGYTNNSAFLPYTDNFGNPTAFKPLELCKEGK